MYELKTRPGAADPMTVIAAIPNENRQREAKVLLGIFERATGKPPVVWGEKMIGFGSYSYQYASGHTGEIYAAGFSVTKSRITLHLYMDEPVLQDYLHKLGKTTSGRSCVYINRLTDIDTALLEEMVHTAYTFIIRISVGNGHDSL